MSAAIGMPETAAVSKNDKNVILLKKFKLRIKIWKYQVFTV
jgi:hypothetical protein